MAMVYLSSTYADLADHREAVYKVLRKMRHDVIAMEDYVATDERPLDKCLADVAGCDVYVGLFAWRYGYIPTVGNPARKSVTVLEYRRGRPGGDSKAGLPSGQVRPVAAVGDGRGHRGGRPGPDGR